MGKYVGMIVKIQGVIDVKGRISINVLFVVKRRAILFYEIKHVFSYGNAKVVTMG